MGKLLVLVGIILVIAGLFLTFNISIPFLGKLPGDITVKGDNYSFYFPIVTCIVLSLILSIILYLFS